MRSHRGTHQVSADLPSAATARDHRRTAGLDVLIREGRREAERERWALSLALPTSKYVHNAAGCFLTK